MFIKLLCIDCKSEMKHKDDFFVCEKCGLKYSRKDNVLVCWSKNISELAKEEANYHDKLEEDANELHQLDSYRNSFYHQYVWQKIKEIPAGETLLEIGAGSGYDAKELIEKYNIVLSDISPETLNRLAKKLEKFSTKTFYVSADGTQLPFVDQNFGGVYMVATWHHLEKYEEALKEFLRVLKPGAKLVIGVEPNSFYFKGIKRIRKLLCKASHTKEDEGSEADAEMVGFGFFEIKEMLEKNNVKNYEIKPMWFFAGWLHYFLEFIFRAFKMKKRIKIPLVIEKGIVKLDELFFKLPVIKKLGWHWIIEVIKL